MVSSCNMPSCGDSRSCVKETDDNDGLKTFVSLSSQIFRCQVIQDPTAFWTHFDTLVFLIILLAQLRNVRIQRLFLVRMVLSSVETLAFLIQTHFYTNLTSNIKNTFTLVSVDVCFFYFFDRSVKFYRKYSKNLL